MNKIAKEGQRVRITFNMPVEFGRYAHKVLWSDVEGVMGADNEIHNLTVFGKDLEYPHDTVCFEPDSYRIVPTKRDEFLSLLQYMDNGEYVVLRWPDSVMVVQKEQGDVWTFCGSSKEYTSEEVADFRGLTDIDRLSYLL